MSASRTRKPNRAARLARARRRAPRHPPGPEARARLTISRLFLAYHRFVVGAVIAGVKRSDARTLRQHAGMAAAHSKWSELKANARLEQQIRKVAEATAKSVVAQLSATLDVGDDWDPDLDPQIDDYANRITTALDEKAALSVDRAHDVLDEWEGLDDDSPRAGDVGALRGMLDDGLDGVTGGALAWAGLAFGDLFADMNKNAQQDAGVAQYTWMTANDSHVRPEHAALDGETCDWDDPPLKAGESSIGEDCHAGEDVNCRCVASPNDPDEEALPN